MEEGGSELTGQPLSLTGRFRRDGLAFSYPEGWSVDEANDGEIWTLTLQSPATSYGTLTIDPFHPDPAEVLRRVVEAACEGMEGVEREPWEGRMAGRPALGCDLNCFLSNHLIGSSVRVVEVERGTITLWFQTAEGARGEEWCDGWTRSIEIDSVAPSSDSEPA